MSYRRVDHAFTEPTVAVANMSYGGRPPVQFGVCAERMNTRAVAHICFASYLVGPGQKIILGRGDIPRRPD